MSNCVRFKVCKGLVVLTKKDAQHESCKLSFIWGKMRTAAREAASQIAATPKRQWGKANI